MKAPQGSGGGHPVESNLADSAETLRPLSGARRGRGKAAAAAADAKQTRRGETVGPTGPENRRRRAATAGAPAAGESKSAPMSTSSGHPPAGRATEVVNATCRLVNLAVVNAQGRRSPIRGKGPNPHGAAGRDRSRTHPRAQHAATGEPGGTRRHALVCPGKLGLQDR